MSGIEREKLNESVGVFITVGLFINKDNGKYTYVECDNALCDSNDKNSVSVFTLCVAVVIVTLELMLCCVGGSPVVHRGCH